MPLPSQLTFNHLSGDEAKHVALSRFTDFLNTIPLLQKHLTLPNMRMTVSLKLEMYAEQPNPEAHIHVDKLDIITQGAIDNHHPVMDTLWSNTTAFDEEAVIDASPLGHPPDQVREEHNIPIPTPVRGQVSLHDQIITRDDGVQIQRDERATIITQDLGPAGLKDGRMNRVPVERTGNKDGQGVQSPRRQGWRE